MRVKMSAWIVAVAAGFTMLAFGNAAGVDAGVDGKAEVAAFNEKFRATHEQMDTKAILAMWSETGVSLLPERAPVVGKQAVTKFMTDAIASLAGYKELKVEMDFHDVRVCGEWATEWAIEHQVIQPPDGKSMIDHWGKFSLILHREADGSWKVQQEMWNSTPKPE